jgi:thiamine transporter ThiT
MSARVGLSIRLGVLGGIIWGLMFTAYYSMLPNYKFAVFAATVCFVVVTIFFLGLPTLIKHFKDAAEERRNEE